MKFKIPVIEEFSIEDINEFIEISACSNGYCSSGLCNENYETSTGHQCSSGYCGHGYCSKSYE